MNPPLDIDIAREDSRWPATLEPLAQTVIAAALEGGGREVTGPCELSILLTDDARQRELNSQWRGKDSATNVLSFPAIGPDGSAMGMLGDLSLAYETVAREAETLGKPFEHHFAHLLVHGTLHILGHDHETRVDALAMEARETDILARLGYPDPYDGEEPED